MSGTRTPTEIGDLFLPRRSEQPLKFPLRRGEPGLQLSIRQQGLLRPFLKAISARPFHRQIDLTLSVASRLRTSYSACAIQLLARFLKLRLK